MVPGGVLFEIWIVLRRIVDVSISIWGENNNEEEL